MRYRRRRNKKQRKIIIVSMCSLLLFMTIGYAAMQSNLEIKAKGNVVKKATGAEAFLDNIDIITSGDGLYKDSYEDNVYTYRGANPNNYVTFNDETAGWRIISINTSDNTIKIIKNVSLGNKIYDGENARNATYCTHPQYGCNIWGSSTTLYDMSSINKISTLAYEVGSSKYALPPEEAELNKYLNTQYYNTTLNSAAKSMIKKEALYKAAPVSSSSVSDLSEQIEYASQAIWKGKVGLLDATEYIRASIGNSVSSNNWLNMNDYLWTMSPYSTNRSNIVWYVDINGNIKYISVNDTGGVYPVVTLSPEVEITDGDGEENNPFQLSL